jgi:hypothetical protein
MKKYFAVLLMVLFVAMAGVAQATVYFGEDLNSSSSVPLAAYPTALAAETLFKSSLVGVGTETFESFGNGTSAPLALVFPGAGTATLQGTGNIVSVTPGSTNGFGRYAISGSNYWEVSASTSSSPSFYIDFSAPVAAFGFYGVDIGDFGGQVVLTFTDGTTTAYTTANTVGSGGSTDGSILFWGVIDTAHPFTKVAFTDTNTDDVFAFDNMTIGSVQQVIPTPEPTSMILLGLGLISLAGLRRKFKN